MNLATRPGSTLLLVMVAISMLAAVAAAGRATAWTGIREIANRHALVRAEYVADACVAHWIAMVESELRGATTSERADSIWVTLPTRSRTVPTSCHLSARAAGASIDVNSSSDSMLHTVLGIVSPAYASRWLDRLRDWGDEDELSRPAGAERARYFESGVLGPSNADFESNAEILLALGADSTLSEQVLSLIGVEHAPLWSGGEAARSLARLGLGSREAVALPIAWTLRARLVDPSSQLCAGVEWRVVRYATRIDVDARRTVLRGETGWLPGVLECP